METDYDNVGRVSRVTVPYTGTVGQTNSTAAATTRTYDGASRPLTITDGGGGTVGYAYNERDVVKTVGPAPSGEHTKNWQYEYDGLGHLLSVCEMTTMSGSGACTQTASQTGFFTSYGDNALGQLTASSQNAQGGSPQPRSYTYDLLGRMTSETNPEEAATVTCGVNQVSRCYTYDTDAACGTSSGDLVKQVDAIGNVTCYKYDGLHRVTQISYTTYSPTANTPTKYFIYDSATVDGQSMQNAEGRLARACTGGTGTGNCGSSQSQPLITDLGFSYSVRGEVTDTYESTPHSAGYYHTNASYWANGLLDELNGPGGMPTITYAPDGEGRISTVSASGTNPVTSTSYNVFGEPVGVTLGSGDSDAYQYDPNTGRMTQYKYTVNGSHVTGNLYWNPNGTLNQLQITDPFDSSNQQTCNYTYDDLARVASANCGSIWNQTFTFDPLGNVTKAGNWAFSPTYSPSTNQMTYLGGSTPTYDANGDLTYDTYNNYAWDAEGHLVTETPVGKAAVTRTYDALGRTVEAGSSNIAYIYDPLGERQFFMTGQTFYQGRATLPGGGIAQYGSGPAIAYYWHMDWQGTARLLSTPSQTVAFDSAFAPYGEQYAATGPYQWVFAFAGTQADVIKDTYDSATRHYYPTQGRWLSPDPAGLAAADLMNPQSFNRYAYVGNSPTNAIDPTGSDCKETNSCPPNYHPSCGNMDCADNPSTFCGGIFCGYNPFVTITAWDEFALQGTPVVIQVGWGYIPVFGPWTPGPAGSDYVSRIQVWGYWGPLYSQTGDAFTILGESGAGLTGPIPISTTSSKMKPVIGYSATVVLPIFYGLGPALTVSSVPSQNLACFAPGIGASVGRTFSFGPIVGDNENIRSVLEGVSFSGGYQFAPWAGAGGSVNYSGAVSGNTFGVPGASATLTYGFCSGL